MVNSRAGSLALVTPFSSDSDAAAAGSDVHVVDTGNDRRAHARLNPLELSVPLSARLKYGEIVTLIDVSMGGALLETSNALRPDADLVLEIVDPRTHDIVPMVSRVLRCHVSQLKGGTIQYRGACVFKRPLTHPALAAPSAMPQPPEPVDFVKLEFALKTIVESYVGRSVGVDSAAQLRDTAILLEALDRLRAAAQRRDDPIDRQLADLLSVVIPALQRNDGSEAVMSQLQQQLRRYVPLLGIRSVAPHDAPASDRELITLNMWSHGDAKQAAVTVEFPLGFGLDESQFRLLKAGAYLTGLVGQWRPAAPEPVRPPSPPKPPTAQSSAQSSTPSPTPSSAQRAAPTPTPGRAQSATPSSAPSTTPSSAPSTTPSSAQSSAPSATPSTAVEAPVAKTAAAADGVSPESHDLPPGWQRVVIRYVDGNLLRGYTNDFHPERAHLHLCPTVNCPAAERLLVPVARLKAVFFVKDLLGNPDHVSTNDFDHSPRARKVQVTFRDDEVIVGSTLNYKPSGQGFYLQPADSQSNNVRVYVVTTAIRHMRFV